MFIEEIIAESMYNTLSDKQKQQIVMDFVSQQINTSNRMVGNTIESLITEECVKELELRKSDIREIVSRELDEKLTDKNFFQTLVIKHKYKNLAKSILEQF